MAEWLSANLSTIIISAVIAAAAVLAAVYIHRNRKNGRFACGGDCAHCALHGEREEEEDPGEKK